MELKEMCYQARKAMSLSQKTFADIIGTNKTEISFIERGFIPPCEDKIEKIKLYYKIACMKGERNEKIFENHKVLIYVIHLEYQ